uniref:Large ribosomal subunit protein uL5m n=4 Tax=Setaria TaxID=4554 RepID=K4ABF1_SETIT
MDFQGSILIRSAAPTSHIPPAATSTSPPPAARSAPLPPAARLLPSAAPVTAGMGVPAGDGSGYNFLPMTGQKHERKSSLPHPLVGTNQTLAARARTPPTPPAPSSSAQIRPIGAMALRYLARKVGSPALRRASVPRVLPSADAPRPLTSGPYQGLRHYATPSSEAVGSELDAPKVKRNRSSISKKSGTAMMLPLHLHYEDVLRQDLLLKQNHANIMQVPGLYEIRLVPKAGSDLRVPIGKLAMEILSGQRFKEAQVDPFAKARKSARTNPFIGAGKDSGSVFARQSVLRGHAMYNFLVRMLTVMSMLDSRAEIRENTIKFFMETEFCEFSPELEDHFEIFEHIRGFNVTIVTSADTKDETSLLWSGFMLNDEGETK